MPERQDYIGGHTIDYLPIYKSGFIPLDIEFNKIVLCCTNSKYYSISINKITFMVFFCISAIFDSATEIPLIEQAS